MASSDVNAINVNVLNQYKSNFTSEKSRFSNNTRKVFSNSYINKCQDSYISSIASKLNQCYDEVESLYSSIEQWWNAYNQEVTSLESVLSGNSSSGALNEQGLREYSKCLPELKDYTVVFQDVVVESNNKSTISATPTIDKSNDKTLSASELQTQLSLSLSTITGGTFAPVQDFGSYNTQDKNSLSVLDDMRQELNNLKTEYNNKYNYFKYNPEENKAHLAKQEELKQKIANFEKAVKVDTAKQEIDNLNEELDALKTEYNNKYNYFKYNPEANKEHLAKQEALKEKIASYEKLITTDNINQEIDNLSQELEQWNKEYSEKYNYFKYNPEAHKEYLAKQQNIKDQISYYEDLKSTYEGKELSQQTTNTTKKEKNGFMKFLDLYAASQQMQYDAQKQTAATMTLVATSAVEGAPAALETMIDGLAVLGTMQQEQQLQNFAITSDQMGFILGEEYDVFSHENAEQLTDEMWEGTKDFVTTEYVKDAFDTFYEDTEFGSYIYDNAAYADQTRATVSSISSFMTQMALGGQAAPFTVGLSSLGRNTSDAWNDGADIDEGIAYGAANAVYDMAEVVLGQWIGGLKIFKGGSALRNQALNSASHVVLDTIDGASSAFVQPLLQMIYAPNEKNIDELLALANKDSEGNIVNNYTSWDEVPATEKYNAMFEHSGGMQNVLTQALMGGSMSLFMGETNDILKSVEIDSIADSLRSGNKNILGEIESLNTSQLEDLVNVSSNKGIMNDLVDSLDSKQLGRVVESLSTADIKKLVENGDIDLLVDKLDGAQLNELYSKIGNNNNLKELKDKVGQKLEELPKIEVEAKQIADEIKVKPIISKEKLKEIKTKFDNALLKAKTFMTSATALDLIEFGNKNVMNLVNLFSNLNYSGMTLDASLVAIGLDSLGTLINKGIYKNVKVGSDTYRKILDEGLYHVTSKENVASILQDGHLNPSSTFLSLGKEKVFMFAGKPSFEDMQANVAEALKNDDMAVIKIKVTEQDLLSAGLRERLYSDHAISHEGKFDFTPEQVSVGFLSIQKENGIFNVVETASKIDSVAGIKGKGKDWIYTGKDLVREAIDFPNVVVSMVSDLKSDLVQKVNAITGKAQAVDLSNKAINDNYRTNISDVIDKVYVNENVAALKRNTNIIKNTADYFLKTTKDAKELFGNLSLKLKALLKNDTKIINEILANVDNPNIKFNDIVTQISQLDNKSLAEVLTKINLSELSNMKKHAIFENLTLKQVRFLEKNVNIPTYSSILKSQPNIIKELSNDELQNVIDKFGGYSPKVQLESSKITNACIEELYNRKILSSLRLTTAEFDTKTSRYNELLEIMNSEVYLNSNNYSYKSMVEEEFEALKLELENAKVTKLDDLDVNIKHKLTDMELAMKKQEYSKLTKMAEEYIFKIENGNVELKPAYEQIKVKLAQMRTEIDSDVKYIKTVNNFYYDSLTVYSTQNMYGDTKEYNIRKIVELFQDENSYDKLLNSDLNDKIPFGVATSKAYYETIKPGGIDFGLTNEQLLKMKNFADTYGNKEIIATIKNNLPIEINLYSKGDTARTINVHRLKNIICDKKQFDLFNKTPSGSDQYHKLFGGYSKFEHVLGINEIFKMAENGEINLTQQQLKRCNALFEEYEFTRINDLKNWANTEMIDTLREFFQDYIAPEKFKNLKNSISFLDDETYKIGAPKGTSGYNSSIRGSVVNLRYTDDYVKNVSIHESLHQLSKGLWINDRYTGLDESVTELLTKLIDSKHEYHSSYDHGVVALQQIFDIGIDGVNLESLMKSYFSETPNGFLQGITDLKGAEFTEKLLDGFNEAIEGNDESLNKLIKELQKTYKKTQNITQDKNVHMLADVINTIDEVNSKPGYGYRVLQHYVQTGNINAITRTNDARQIIKSMDKEFIARQLDEGRLELENIVDNKKARFKNIADVNLSNVEEKIVPNLNEVQINKNEHVSVMKSVETNDISSISKENLDSNNISNKIDIRVKEIMDNTYIYSLEQIKKDCPNYQEICNMFFELVKDNETKIKLEEILYNGKYQDYYLTSNICSHDNPFVEARRRISMAYLLTRNPETFDVIVSEKVNLFHGTNANALPSILKYGLNSGVESERQGIKVTTGEKWSRIGGHRKFVSFSDVVDVSYDYATIDSDFEVVIGTTVKEAIKNGRIFVESAVTEVGIKNKLPIEGIKAIGVPSNKVDYVKKLLNNDSIKIVAMDGIRDRFYWADSDYYSIELYNDKVKNMKDELLKSKNSSVFKLEDIKQMMTERLKIRAKK